MLKIYLDSEFTGLQKNTDLISIGLVSETGSKFYAEFNDYDTRKIDAWIRDHVISQLKLIGETTYSEISNERPYTEHNKIDKIYDINIKNNTTIIREELHKWLQNEYYATGEQIQIYSDCYAYDWVLLVDLLTHGKSAIDIPEYLSYIPIDLSTLLWAIGVDPDIDRIKFAKMITNNDTIHNALFDAQVIKLCFDRIHNQKELGLVALNV